MQCSAEDCTYETPSNIPTYELVIRTLEIHTQTVHRIHSGVSHGPTKTEKPKRPILTTGMSEAEWEFFIHRWERYKRQTNLSEQGLLDELWATLDLDLERLAFHDNLQASTATELLEAIKNLAVTVLHPSVHIVALHEMKQGETETTKMFSARVKGVANNCNLKKKCTRRGCNETVSFVDETCYHVVLSGIADCEMKEKILTQAMLGTVNNLTTLLNYTTAEESAKTKSLPREIAQVTHESSIKNKKCAWCSKSQHGENNINRLTQCRAMGQQCAKCKKFNHFAVACRQKNGRDPPNVNEVATDLETAEEVEEVSVSGFITAITGNTMVNPADAKPVLAALRDKTKLKWNTLPVPHMVFDTRKNQWSQQHPKSPPVLQITAALDRAAYKELKLNLPELVRKPGAGHARARVATADTGAQLTVMNTKELQALGIKAESIFPLATSVNTVTKKAIEIIGGVFLRLSAHDERSGKVSHTRQLCYISNNVKGIYLSEDACKALQVIPTTFPTAGDCSAMEENVDRSGKCENTGVGENSECKCPRRSLPPESKPQLPCEPIKENLHILKQYILDRYADSGFNCCENQPLPLMDSAPPLRLFVDAQATPVAAYTPSIVPAHWNEEVKKGLDRDVKLGVLEPVPVNEPAKWCSRMVVTPKPDGSPRRVIDFGPVNKNAPRQPHHTKSPHTIVMSVPGNTIKSVLDNWHGYHSVPIHQEDRHLTTFITPYGRYRYRTAPQGFISAGDGYTHRMDLIVEGVENFEHCVDDSILWDQDIESNFFRICNFIERCARAGCIFNPTKFQFGQEEVEFLGFRITQSGIKPTDKFIKKIMDFPTPANLTDVRSWFGLINQVSYTFAIAEHMAPFRSLLSSKVPFSWSQELDEAFHKSKEEIIKQCSRGVRNFTLNAPTALATDWSKQAVGCWLSQKFCKCAADIPGCCNSGWQTIFVSSKFNNPTVSNYHPIEGEAFAASWALEKCKFFVLGHPDLKLVVDHKPLLAILGPEQELSELANPRLLNLKLKTSAFKFTPRYVPGKLHVVPDTMSRRSDSPAHHYPTLPKNPPPANNVQAQYAETFGPPSWVSAPIEEEMYKGYIAATLAGLQQYNGGDNSIKKESMITWPQLKQACQECPKYLELANAVANGFPVNEKDWSENLSPYRRVHKELTLVDNVVMLQNRIVVPEALRKHMLTHLHACHSGTKGMMQRALSDVYWPDYATDIIRHRENCVSCNINAPSNPKLPPTQDPEPPLYPFHTICMDFFSIHNKNYLAIADKYSGWLSILQLEKDNSRNVIKALREYFATFGVCEVACSDGAPVFVSKEMQDFYQLWGIKARISSAYHPSSNKRAEIAVKSAKRLIRENLGPNNSINSDKLAKALLAHRNTPDAISKTSPAMIVFGHPIRDHIPRQHYTPSASWKDLAEKREQSFLKRHYAEVERLERGTRKMEALGVGDLVYVQEQFGNTPKKWSKSGTVVEHAGHDSYLVKIDGSGKLTRRNRQFLRKFTPFQEKAAIVNNIAHDQEAPLTLLQQASDFPIHTMVSMAEANYGHGENIEEAS